MTPTLVSESGNWSSGTPGASMPQRAWSGLGVVTGWLDIGVGRHLEPARVHQHPASAHSSGDGAVAIWGRRLPHRLVGLAGFAGAGRDLRQHLTHCLDALVLPDLVERGQLPAAGRAQRDSVSAGAAKLSSHQQQPGMEHRRGVRTLRVLEERRVHRTGRVVEGQEDDPPHRADRWGLGGHLHPGNEEGGLAALTEQIPGTGYPELVEERGVEVHDVPADIEPQDLELGVWEKAAAQSRATKPAGPVTSVQLALDLGDTPGDGEVSGLLPHT